MISSSLDYKNSKIKHMSKKILIVGAGPVGLAAAWFVS
jgi:NADPH-dependent 2,4-dienoyl-CoA reductase/sulfur reductase-like enzyme